MEVKLDVEEDEHEESYWVLSSIRNQKIKLLKDVVERDDNVNLSGLKGHFISVSHELNLDQPILHVFSEADHD